ncbi:MAG TPA: hypothetical protein VL404_00745 [Candidatus Eisenbacteria bacterium]|jgi:hypothetical protein|nr:hypothetical protein [Candidatus Eisenbacteria bacterium]
MNGAADRIRSSIPRGLGALLVVAFVFYALVFLKGRGIDYWYKAYDTRYYQELAEAFLSGRLDLPRQVPPEILSNPHDFTANAARIYDARMFDLSLYEGRVYLYFGAVPAALFYAPFRLLIGRGLPDAAAVTFFSFGSVLFTTYLLCLLRKAYFPSAPGWMALASAAALAFANGTPFLIRDSRVYEVAISSGVFFATASAACWLSAVVDRDFSWRRMALGSLLLGLAVGCRPIYVWMAAALLPWMAVLALRASAGRPAREESLRALVLPLVFMAVVLGLYNFLRFGNPLEFGVSYQMNEPNLFGIAKAFAPDKVFHNIHFLFFQEPLVDDAFPFVYLNRHVPFYILTPGNVTFREGQGTVGLLPGIPFLWIAFLAPAVWWACAEDGPSTTPRWRVVVRALCQTVGLYFAVYLLADPRGPFQFRDTAAFSVLLANFKEEVPALIPFLAILFGNVVWDVRCRLRAVAPGRRPPFPWREWGALASAFTAIAAVYFFYMAINVRYTCELAWPAILLTAGIWFYFDALLECEPLCRRAVRVSAVAAAVLSAYFWIVFSYLK